MFDTTRLLPPQIPHTKKLVDSLYLNGFALDHSDCGTGKTFCAAAVIREMNLPAFIICPKSVISSWQRVLTMFDLKATIINYEKLGRGNTKWMRWKKLQNLMRPWEPESKDERPYFTMNSNSLVVLDEGHRCKGDDTTNSKMLVSLVDQGYKVLVASATIATTPLEMKAVGFMAGLHSLYNFTDFMRLHGAQWTGRFGSMTWDAASKEATKSMMILNEYLFDSRKCSSRLTVEQFGDLFPESHIMPTAFDLGENTDKIQAVYDSMEAEIAQLEERCENYSEHIFAILMAARRRAEMLKVPVMVEKILDLHAEGKSVAAFLNFTDTIDAISARLKKVKGMRIGYIVGGQSAKARETAINDFQSDESTVILCNISAGNAGISLHDTIGKRPRGSVISPTWSAINLRQCLGRVWRQGGKTKSVQYIVYAAGCVEEQICRRVEMRLNSLNVLNDGDLAETMAFTQDVA